MMTDLRGSFALSTPGEHDIVMTRDFAAPPAIVFAAFTTADHIRLVDPMPDPETLVTLDLVPSEGRTLVTVRIRHPSGQSRERHLASGMAWEVRQSYDRLDALVQTLADA